jgi:hypothetical protein
MTFEELRSRLDELAGSLSATRRELEALLPHLATVIPLRDVLGMLRDVSRVAANCAAARDGGLKPPPPFYRYVGPRLPGAPGDEKYGVIYALTQVGGPDPNRFGRPRQQPIGFFWSLEQAEEMLATDTGCLNEAGFFPWAVIEEVCPGLHPTIWDQRYWEYDRQAEQWGKAAGCPAALEGHLREYYGEGSWITPNWCDIG